MPRTKPTPPAAPFFPLLSIDGLAGLLLRPLTNPLFALLPPLIVLSLNPDTNNQAFYSSCYFSVGAIAFQVLWYLNSRLAGGQQRTVDWAKEVVLITGGAGGLGRVLAEYYGSIRRATTVVVDILPASEQRKNEWTALGCAYYECDVGDFESITNLQRKIDKDIGKVSILILAAGIVNSSSILNLSKEEIQACVNVNLMGAIWSVKAFLPAMISDGSQEHVHLGGNAPGFKDDHNLEDELVPTRGGTIVTVSSVLGYLGAAGLADYTATKAALTAFHESLRAELSIMSAKMHQSPRVNTILATPGQLSTALFAHVPAPPLASFLGPTVTPAALATEIIRAVDEGRDKELSMPLYTQWIGTLRILPAGIAKIFRLAVGLDWAGWQGTMRKKDKGIDI